MSFLVVKCLTPNTSGCLNSVLTLSRVYNGAIALNEFDIKFSFHGCFEKDR